MATATNSSASSATLLARNRRAFFEYEVIETLECGIELKGSEVKALKGGRFSFIDAYARIRDGQMWLIGLHISEYRHSNIFNHEPLRTRRLLAHREELKRLARKVALKGVTLVPLAFRVRRGLVKLELGICHGKQAHDKREAIRRRDQGREQERELRGRT